jgi:hypothetical protein
MMTVHAALAFGVLILVAPFHVTDHVDVETGQTAQFLAPLSYRESRLVIFSAPFVH